MHAPWEKKGKSLHYLFTTERAIKSHAQNKNRKNLKATEACGEINFNSRKHTAVRQQLLWPNQCRLSYKHSRILYSPAADPARDGVHMQQEGVCLVFLAVSQENKNCNFHVISPPACMAPTPLSQIPGSAAAVIPSFLIHWSFTGQVSSFYVTL